MLNHVLRQVLGIKRSLQNRNGTMAKRILLTGAAGQIGTAFRNSVGERYDLRLADRHLSKLGDPGGHEVVKLEVADLKSCQEACKGVDMIIHLAADPSPTADFYGSLLNNNIKGTYNIFRAAKDQRCQRVIFASSIRAVIGHPEDVLIHPDSPVRPLDMYGVSKCFGEAVAHYFAFSEDLSSIVIRVGAFGTEWIRENPTASSLSTFISQRDMSHLLVQCIETPNIQFTIVHGVSNNRLKRFDITNTVETLGYHPQDDAFQTINTGSQR
jgi:NAD+ dependent glucose-6-phosphate dehydrogenase